MSTPSTKDRILDSALNLFSEKGYDGVGVDLIAQEAGVKGPSIYKHYAGKESILNALLDRTEEYYEKSFGSENRPGRIPESAEELVRFTMERIRFTMKDPVIRKIRRILTMEQFRNERIASLETKHSMDGLTHMFGSILGGMMKNGLIRQDDPMMLAQEYIAAVTLLIQMVDREPDREEEAMQRIEAHLKHFVKVYGNDNH